MKLNLFVVVMIGLSFANPSWAVIAEVTSCGDTLSQPGEYILATDLDCSGTFANGINISASNVVLHLAGHTLSSTDCNANLEVNGISVPGGLTNVQIDGGTVSGFNDGIVLYSSDSIIMGTTVKGACFFGIAVSGQRNQLKKNVVTESGIDGIGVGQASQTIIASNYISWNTRVGVDISNSSSNNVVHDNIINNNGTTEGVGVAIFGGTNNVIKQNAVNFNFNGISIDSPGNYALDNSVNGNSNTGISIGAVGASSTVRRNTVLGSGVVDMSDGSAECDSNTWKNKIFQTDLVVGVSDGGPGTGCIK
jgi:parallel beta-helix repeat protein